MRWLKELQTPSLKCKRLGHRDVIEFRMAWRRYDSKKDWRFYPAVKITQERNICERCGAIHEDWHEVNADGFDSVTWPSSYWDELKANGIRLTGECGQRHAQDKGVG